MPEYYIVRDGEKKGPYTCDDLKLKLEITSNTLVWRDDFDDWKKAKDVDELKNIFKKEPPPIPKEDAQFSNKKKESSEKSRVKTAKEIKKIFNLIGYSAIIGVISFFVFSIYVYGAFKWDDIKKEDISLSGNCIQSRVPLSDTNPYGDIRISTRYGGYTSIDTEFRRFKEILNMRKEDLIYKSIFSAFCAFLIFSVILIMGRYLFKGLNWVNIESRKNIE